MRLDFKRNLPRFLAELDAIAVNIIRETSYIPALLTAERVFNLSIYNIRLS